MVQLNPNDRFFLLMANLKVIKTNNFLSQQFKVTGWGVWIIRLVPLCYCVNPRKQFSYSITFWSLKQRRHDCKRHWRSCDTKLFKQYEFTCDWRWYLAQTPYMTSVIVAICLMHIVILRTNNERMTVEHYPKPYSSAR